MCCTMWTIPPYLLTSYYYHYSPYGCDDTRVHGYIFWGGGLPGLALLVSGFGRECAELTLDCIGVWGQPPFIICATFGNMMMDLSTRDGCNTR